jgi:hypothetical protein
MDTNGELRPPGPASAHAEDLNQLARELKIKMREAREADDLEAFEEAKRQLRAVDKDRDAAVEARRRETGSSL